MATEEKIVQMMPAWHAPRRQVPVRPGAVGALYRALAMFVTRYDRTTGQLATTTPEEADSAYRALHDPSLLRRSLAWFTDHMEERLALRDDKHGTYGYLDVDAGRLLEDAAAHVARASAYMGAIASTEGAMGLDAHMRDAMQHEAIATLADSANLIAMSAHALLVNLESAPPEHVGVTAIDDAEHRMNAAIGLLETARIESPGYELLRDLLAVLRGEVAHA